MAKFHSTIPHLVLQDGDAPTPWAAFVDHVFHTDDSTVADRLRGLDPDQGITEEPEDAATPIEDPSAPAPAPALVDPAPVESVSVVDPTPVEPAPADPIA